MLIAILHSHLFFCLTTCRYPNSLTNHRPTACLFANNHTLTEYHVCFFFYSFVSKPKILGKQRTMWGIFIDRLTTSKLMLVCSVKWSNWIFSHILIENKESRTVPNYCFGRKLANISLQILGNIRFTFGCNCPLAFHISLNKKKKTLWPNNFQPNTALFIFN